MRKAFTHLLPLLALSGLTACDRAADGTLQVAVIGNPEGLFTKGVRLSSGAQHLRAATAAGLVSLDANGDVIPALADRWIVTDDGRSYIFRLREGTWPDGSDLTSESARDLLQRRIAQLAGTSLGLDFGVVSEIRAMAGRVVEVRLEGPEPDFLQLLAQPELSLEKGGGAGPMRFERNGDLAHVQYLPPEERGLPLHPGWQAEVRPLDVQALPAAKAIELFDENEVDVVLNGTLTNFPLVETGPLSRGTVRLDPVIGIFGLKFVEDKGVLSDRSLREAISMAIDRERFARLFNVGGWNPSTRLVPSGLPSDLGTIGERWTDLPLQERQAEARRRIARWVASQGENARPSLRIALPAGPGADLIFDVVSTDLAKVGLAARRVGLADDADLRLLDNVARYAGARWFLNQFNCKQQRIACSPLADALVAEATQETDLAARSALLAEAEAELTAANGFIPFGSPIRWSLVRSGVPGFANNRWAFHPLPDLARLTR